MITVDKDICIGCGLCISTCPQVFELGKNGKAQVKDSKGDKKYSCAKEAAENCPVKAIKIK